MLISSAKGAVIDICQGPECTSECNTIKSDNTVTPEATLKNGLFAA